MSYIVLRYKYNLDSTGLQIKFNFLSIEQNETKIPSKTIETTDEEETVI